MKRWKIASVLLAVVLVVTGSFGYYLWDKNVELRNELRNRIDLLYEKSILENRLGELEFQNEELKSEKEELESRISRFEKEIESLKEELQDTSTSIGLPKKVGEITYGELQSVLQRYYPTAYLIILDEKYKLASAEDFKQFLNSDLTDRLPRMFVGETKEENRAEFMDCDDFALRLKGQAVKAGFQNLGVIGGIRKINGKEVDHARNIFITREDGKIVIYEVEPQTDEMIKVDTPDYKTFFIII